MDLFVQTIVNGVIQSGFYALAAIGLVLVFGVMRVVNFAHGELVMVGAYTVWLVHAQYGAPYLLTVILAIVVVTGIGLIMERYLFRPMMNDPLGGLICSIGVLFILQVIATYVGGEGPSKQVPPPFEGTMIIMDTIRIPYQRLFSICVSAVALVALWYFLTKSTLGWALRAVSMDRDAAALQGISTVRISMVAIGVGAAMAGVGRCLDGTTDEHQSAHGAQRHNHCFHCHHRRWNRQSAGSGDCRGTLCAFPHFHDNIFQWNHRHDLGIADHGACVDCPTNWNHGTQSQRIR